MVHDTACALLARHPEARAANALGLGRLEKPCGAECGLPEWINVTLADCGEANVFCAPAAGTMTIFTQSTEDLDRLWPNHHVGDFVITRKFCVITK